MPDIDQGNLPNVTVEWLALLLHIQEFLGPEPSYFNVFVFKVTCRF
jgi:hypothetical protein